MIRAWQKIKNLLHWVRAQWWRAYYRWPDKKLVLHGVTGTNGKTTTCYILTSVLEEAFGADKVGMLTTVSFRVGEKTEVNESKMTTLKSAVVMKYLRKMVNAGVEKAVLEVTSHALDQHRLAGLRFRVAIITNIAREHLDYHGTMKEYALAKAKIVNMLEADGILVGKGDDKLVKEILLQAKEKGIKTEQWTSEQAKNVETHLLGSFNQENAAAVKLAAEAVGITADKIKAGINYVKVVPGRMEWIRQGNKPAILIDYAVTPDALERLYDDVRVKTEGKVWGILGACGLRDRGKRPLMSAAVAERADELVLTREDPWTEDEEQIFQDLEEGLKEAKIPWQRITDRREAIQYCIEQAQAGDTIVVTGKGAETGMAIGHKIVPWNEKQVVLDVLNRKI